MELRLKSAVGSQKLCVDHTVCCRDCADFESDPLLTSTHVDAPARHTEERYRNAASTGLKIVILLKLALLFSISVFAQERDNGKPGDIETVFNGSPRSINGYGAVANKFTTIRGEYANLLEAYGGLLINHKLFLGIGAAALTNRISVPGEYSIDPLRDMRYEYGQFGLVAEYILSANKPYHIAFGLFSGAGFTVQNERHDWHDDANDFEDESGDTNWFFVAEPGVQFEVNIFKWMRFSPGISYRAAFGSDGLGMKDANISNISYNATLKFGRF